MVVAIGGRCQEDFADVAGQDRQIGGVEVVLDALRIRAGEEAAQARVRVAGVVDP